MAKKRVHELAKELGIASKALLVKLAKAGHEFKSALSCIEPDLEAVARTLLAGNDSAKPAKPTKSAKSSKSPKPTKSAKSPKPTKPAKSPKPAKPTKSAKSSKSPKPAKPAKSPKPTKSAGKKEVKKETMPISQGKTKKERTSRPPKPGVRRAGASPSHKKPPTAPGVEKKKVEEPVDPELQAALEKSNRLLDIEENVQRQMGKSEVHPQRRKIVRVIEENRGPAPANSQFRRPTRPSGGYQGRRRGGPQFRGQGGGASLGRRGRYKRQKQIRMETRAEAVEQARETERTTLRIGDSITVSDLAKYMGIGAIELVKKLLGMGVMASINQRVDFDTATVLASDYGYQIQREAEAEVDLLPSRPEIDPKQLQTRPAVVTVMGHVDHGKTSLLDAIRKTDVVSGESGGITQHIGAYQVTIPGGQVLTFLDTPGHEAFTAMRAHGAQITDIAVLVIAADDGVKPQTIEAISHARAADVPIIIALNKIDIAGVNIDKVYQELSQHDLLPEEWGGKTIVCKVSAKEKKGINELLEMIVLQSEMMEIRATPDGPGLGVVIESKIDKGRGPVATVLVQHGLINRGDVFVAGTVYGRVRAMEDYNGCRVDVAHPGQPIEIMGFQDLPQVAEPVRVVESEQQARQIAAKRDQRRKQAAQAVGRRPSLEELLAQAKQSESKEVRVILRADVQGSTAAVREALGKLTNEEGLKVKCIMDGTGSITESDVMFASASEALIIGFHVRPPATVLKLAEREGVEVRLYSVIYQALEDMQDLLNGLLAPKRQEVVLGQAQVRNVFSIPKLGRIAGCYISEGLITRNAEARLIRDGVEIYLGKVASLRRFKDDVKEVQSGYECGIRLENYQDIKESDVIEAFRIDEVARN